MVRSCHSLLAHGHALWQYVDDLLAWLDKSSSPLWASLIVWRCPCHGTKQRFQTQSIGLAGGYRSPLGPSKSLLRNWSESQLKFVPSKVPHAWHCVTCSRLWDVFCGWLLHGGIYANSLYHCTRLCTAFLSLWCMDHVTFQTLTAQLDDQLQLRNQLTHTHQSLRKGVTLCRVANTNVNTLTDVKLLHIKSRRVWVGLSDPSTPNRKLDAEAAETNKTTPRSISEPV